MHAVGTGMTAAALQLHHCVVVMSEAMRGWVEHGRGVSSWGITCWLHAPARVPCPAWPWST